MWLANSADCHQWNEKYGPVCSADGMVTVGLASRCRWPRTLLWVRRTCLSRLIVSLAYQWNVSMAWRLDMCSPTHFVWILYLRSCYVGVHVPFLRILTIEIAKMCRSPSTRRHWSHDGSTGLKRLDCWKCKPVFSFYLPRLWGRGSLSVPSYLRSLPSRLEVGTAIAVKGSGVRISSPSSPCAARPANVFRCILGLNLHPFDCSMTNNFLCLLSVKEFPWCTGNSCPGRKKRLRVYNLPAV